MDLQFTDIQPVFPAHHFTKSIPLKLPISSPGAFRRPVHNQRQPSGHIDQHVGQAIDQGVDAGVTNDMDHHPRPYQEPNIGADEYWPHGALKFIYLPVITR
jgi:hypothetical protein